MKTAQSLTLAMLAGVGIGAVAMSAIHAQQPKTPPAYVIAEVEPAPARKADPAAARRYAEEAPKSIAAFGGRYVVRGGAVQTVEGEAPKGILVVIGFDSLAQARGWYDSPAYRAIQPIRANSTRSRILIVEGVAPPN